MAFSTGSASDVFDLLDKLRLFALSVGWTVNKNTTDELYLQRGSDYWSFKAGNDLNSLDQGSTLGTAGTGGSWVNPGIAMQGNRGFDTGLAWNAQPGESKMASLMGVFHNTTVPEYMFFADNASPATYIHVIARRDTSYWTMLALGVAEKFGTWTGGAYQTGYPLSNGSPVSDGGFEFWRGDDAYSSSANEGSAIHADIDGLTDAWQNTSYPISPNRLLVCHYPFVGNTLAYAQYNNWSGRNLLIPLDFYLAREDGNYPTSFSYGGRLPDLRYCWDPAITHGSEHVIGSDTWVFCNFIMFKKIT